MLAFISILIHLALAGLITSCGDDNNGGGNTLFDGSGEVSYNVSFDAEWSASTHPDYHPDSAHFSSVFIATHNASASFWAEGELATPGIKLMAESGNNSTLENEADAKFQQGNVKNYNSGSGLSASPSTVNFTFSINSSHPLVTVVSMLAPSSDWFVGVSGLDLYPNNMWVDEMTIDLFTYDAGTSATKSALPIAQINTTPFLVSDNVVRVGRLVFTRQVDQ